MSITYETLFEILRKEKNQEDLQQLDPSFFKEIKKYLAEKNKSLEEKPRLDNFMEGHESEQTARRIQLQNIKKLIRDVFDRREKKIVEMAVNKARTGSNIIETSALLPEEKVFFDVQIKAISGFRSEILDSILSVRKQAETPEIKQDKPKELNTAPKEPDNTAFKKVQVTESVPKFVGVDLEVYGPYDENAEVELQPEIAEMLVKTNKARIVE